MAKEKKPIKRVIRGSAKGGAASKSAKKSQPTHAPARRASFNEAVNEAVGTNDGRNLPAARGPQELDSPQTVGKQYHFQADFTRDEIQMPKLKLGQSMTAEVQDGLATLGQWIGGPGEEAVDTVVVVPMCYARGRILNEEDNGPIICSSNDQEIGVGDPLGQGQGEYKCKGCPKSLWTKAKRGGKNVPPECVPHLEYGIYSITHQQMMTMMLKSSAMNAAKYLNTLAMKAGFGNFAIELGAMINTGDRGKFAVPTIKIAKITPKELETAREQFSFGQ